MQNFDSVLRCRKCGLGSSPTGELIGQIMILERILLDQGEKEPVELGYAVMCPTCKEVPEIRANGKGREYQITVDMLKRAVNGFKRGHLTLAEVTGQVKPPKPTEATPGPVLGRPMGMKPMNYNPDAYISPRGPEIEEKLF